MMLDDSAPGACRAGGRPSRRPSTTALESFAGGRRGPTGRSCSSPTARTTRAGSSGHQRARARAGPGLRHRHRHPRRRRDPGRGGAGRPLLKDHAGNVVRTALRQETLERIAVATGGMYAGSAADDAGWDRIVERGIATLKRDEQLSKLVKVREERFPWFLGAAILALSAEALLAERRRRKPEDQP